MIKRLHLENFGRFRKKTFDFAPVTVFYGPNEAGKTTLFDALTDVISSPKASTTPGKILTGRYGKDRLVTHEFEGEQFKISPEDFLNFFAIRAGSISLEIDKNSEWMNRVKASLFSGGVDPQTIMSDLKKIYANRSPLNNEVKKLDEDRKSLLGEKKVYEDIRAGCLADENRIAGEENRMVRDAGEIAALEASQKELEKTLDQQNLLREEKSLKNILSLITETYSKKDEQEKYSRFDPAVLINLRKIEAESAQMKSEQDKNIANEEIILQEISVCKSEKNLYEEKKTKGDSVRALADILRDTLVPREKLIGKITRRVWRKPILAAAGLFIIAGAAVFFLAEQNPLFPAIALGAALVCTAFSSSRITQDDSSKLDDAIMLALGRWYEATGEKPAANYEDVLTALNRGAERAGIASEEYKRASDRITSLEQRAADLALQKNRTGNEIDALQRRLRSLLDEAGMPNVSEYTIQLDRKKNIDSQYNDLKEKIKITMTEHRASSLKELKEIIEQKKSEVSRKITENELPAQEIRVADNRLREIKAQLEELRPKNMENTGNFKKDLGLIRGRLQGLPEKIAACENSIKKNENRLEEIKREMRAAEIAHYLFSSLSDDSDEMLEQLSDEIGKIFSSLTEDVRSINMKSYSEKAINVSDAQGEKRSSEHLSDGTRDAFLFAARLCLARKSMEGDSGAILVLDEPFLALDRLRTNRALALLKEFRSETSWQIILFTKDTELSNHAKTVFGDEAHVYELG